MSDGNDTATDPKEYRLMAKLVVRLYADDLLVAELDDERQWADLLGKCNLVDAFGKHLDSLQVQYKLDQRGVYVDGTPVACPGCGKLAITATGTKQSFTLQCTECGWSGGLDDLKLPPREGAGDAETGDEA